MPTNSNSPVNNDLALKLLRDATTSISRGKITNTISNMQAGSSIRTGTILLALLLADLLAHLLL